MIVKLVRQCAVMYVLCLFTLLTFIINPQGVELQICESRVLLMLKILSLVMLMKMVIQSLAPQSIRHLDDYNQAVG